MYNINSVEFLTILVLLVYFYPLPIPLFVLFLLFSSSHYPILIWLTIVEVDV